jgi:hypothetical protein
MNNDDPGEEYPGQRDEDASDFHTRVYLPSRRIIHERCPKCIYGTLGPDGLAQCFFWAHPGPKEGYGCSWAARCSSFVSREKRQGRIDQILQDEYKQATSPVVSLDV